MNYIIEDTVNFYAQINDTTDDDCCDDVDTCLITHEPLLSDFVKMDCGHKFNYSPLFNDVFNHKQKYNALEKSSGKLKYNEIRCPYCRNKQTTMLPYYEDKEFGKVPGVNFLGASKCYGGVLCAHKYNNEEFDVSLPESDQNLKLIPCTSTFTYKIFANKYNDHNYYCYYHTKVVSNMYKAKAKAEAKQILKAAKEAVIQQAKAEKELAKAAAKAAKDLAKAIANSDKAIKSAIANADKAIAKSNKSANKATTIKDTTNAVLCSHIFMRGKNIGSCCGVKVSTGSNATLCKKHSSKIPIVENN